MLDKVKQRRVDLDNELTNMKSRNSGDVSLDIMAGGSDVMFKDDEICKNLNEMR